MLRFYSKFTILMLVVWGLVLIAAQLFGRWQHGALLFYYYRLNEESGFNLALFDPTHRLSMSLTDFVGRSVFSLQLTAAGRFSFIACLYNECDVWLSDGIALSNLTPSPLINAIQPAWVSESELAYRTCGEGCDIWLWHDDGTTVNLTRTPEIIEAGLAASSDGQLAYVACDTTTCDVWLWDGSIIRQLTDLDGHESDLQWRADGHLAYVVCYGADCNVWLWNGQTNQRVTRNPDWDFSPVLWNAAGQFLTRGCSPFTCDLWLWDGQSNRNLTNTSNFNENFPAWSADGRLAYNMCDFESRCALWLWDGTNTYALSNTTSFTATTPIWSVEGQIAFSGCIFPDCDLWLWDGAQLIQLTDTFSSVELPLAWLP